MSDNASPAGERSMRRHEKVSDIFASGSPAAEAAGKDVSDKIPPLSARPQSSEKAQPTSTNAIDNLENHRFSEKPMEYGGAKTKYKNNVAAIRTLLAIEREGRPATKDEQALMSRYVGWGGIPQAFDEKHDGWHKEYDELKGLLNDDEYEQARRSTLNAHYTPPEMIREIYKAIEKTGFSGGRVGEPACGTGNWFGAMPESWDVDMHGVELDSISGRIAQQLYPSAKIQIKGYQDALFPDGFFDACFGNVPFGNYTLADPRYNKHGWSIHEYFFGKTLDKVRPGGLVVFITSMYLMDRRDNKTRQYLAQRAELLGAVRLPAGSFGGIANTEVTTDVLFLRKREKEVVCDTDWVHLGIAPNGIPVNEYFAEHPNHMLGTMEYNARMYGNEKSTACINTDSEFALIESLSAVLDEIAADGFEGKYTAIQDDGAGEGDTIERPVPLDTIPADPSVKNYTYTLVADTASGGEALYYRENDEMIRQEIEGVRLARLKGLISIRIALRDVLDTQTKEDLESRQEQARAALNAAYDTFIAAYGYLNAKANDNVFKEDIDRPLLQSLEVPISKTEYRKSDIFTRRTIHPPKELVITNAGDALAASLNRRGRVDLDYMSEVYHKPIGAILAELGDRIYYNPQTSQHETADEYLSGNVKAKLLFVQEQLATSPELKRNERALLAVQPERIGLGSIIFNIGTPWIPLEIKHRFLCETMAVPEWARESEVRIKKDEFTTRFTVYGKGLGYSLCKVNASEVYGTHRRNAFILMEDSLNIQISSVYDIIEDEEGKKKRVLNPEQTQLARAKQAALQSQFTTWVMQDRAVVRLLEDIYNERFNVYVTRKFDGSNLEIHGLSEEIKLRPHQMDLAARILFDKNVLAAHEVGAGKTYSLAAGGQLLKQTGLANKPMYVVPNHLLSEWAKSFYKLFPAANLLIATKRDFQKTNRQRFVARIATGSYDGVLLTHSQFEKIQMSPEYRSEMIKKEVAEITAALKSSEDRSFSVKRLEKQRISLEERLEVLATEADSRKDNVLYFEELGVDALFVDEAHHYKNCYFHTKIQNVAGLGGTRAEKSFDMLMKTKYINDITNETGITFATGTPITNSLSEMYVMQRYLQNDLLKEMDVAHFDDWAGTFATVESVLEIAPEGTGFRDRTRFSTFNNLPELVTAYHQIADIKLIDDLEYIKRPEFFGGKPEVIVTEPSEFVQKYIAQLAVEAEDVRAGKVDPSENNMLLITTKGRNVAIDPRLVDETAPRTRESKIFTACDKIVEIYKEYDADKAIQTAFQDVGISLYKDMKEDLVAQGIPEYEIAFIHDADNDKKKTELFEKCRTGEVRVLFGSTAKMGAGTNIQDRMIALHDIDCPWKPSDLEQRHGRIRRQGNQFEKVHAFQYVTRGTFDSYMFQTLEHKQRFISQVMTNKSPARSCPDLDETVLGYGEIKSLSVGDSRVKEVFELDIEIKRLQLERQSHMASQDRLQKIVDTAPGRITHLDNEIQAIQQDIDRFQEPAEFGIEIQGVHYDSRKDAGKALHDSLSQQEHPAKVGSYAGFDLVGAKMRSTLILEGAHKYSVSLGTSELGNIQKIENTPLRFPLELDNRRVEVTTLQEQAQSAEKNIGKPFEKDDELKALSEKKAALDFEIETELKRQTPDLEHEAEYEP